MNRRRFLLGATGGVLAATYAADAQQAGKVPRVGILVVGYGGTLVQSNSLPAFLQGMRELGWVEGQNIAFERRVAVDAGQSLNAFAAELVRVRVAVILAAGGPATLNAARGVTKSVPIVMVASSRDPVGDGLIQSYARPGGNITGIVTAPQGFTGKQIELLHSVVGGANPRFGFLHDATAGPLRIDEPTAEITRALGIDLRVFAVLTPDELGAAIAAAAKERVAGLILPGSPMLVANRRQIAESLLKYRLPGISVWRSLVESGLLMAYGPDLRSEFRRAADYVDKILKGASPADLPVEQPTKFELVINAKTAKAVGVTIPQSLLVRADQIIE